MGVRILPRERAAPAATAAAAPAEGAAAADAAAAPDAHIRYQLRRPFDDRPLLIASRTEVEVSHRVIWRSRLGLAMFIGGTLYVLFALQRYLT